MCAGAGALVVCMLIPNHVALILGMHRKLICHAIHSPRIATHTIIVCVHMFYFLQKDKELVHGGTLAGLLKECECEN